MARKEPGQRVRYDRRRGTRPGRGHLHARSLRAQAGGLSAETYDPSMRARYYLVQTVRGFTQTRVVLPWDLTVLQ